MINNRPRIAGVDVGSLTAEALIIGTPGAALLARESVSARKE